MPTPEAAARPRRAVPVLLLLLAWLAPPLPSAADPPEERTRTIHGRVQTRPGGPVTEAELKVVQVPVDPPALTAREADLPDQDLVLGVVVEGRPMAYPVRYLALHEVVDDRVGETPLAPSW